MYKNISCKDCEILIKSIFKSLSDEDIERLNLEKACNKYKKGSIIYHEGNRMNGFYCVNSGILKLYKTGVEGKEQIIRFGKRGDIIGYRSILSDELACTTAKVIEDAVLCFIPTDLLMSILKNNADFSLEILQLACRELGESNSFMAEIAQKTVRERLAEVLLILMNNFELDNNKVLQISLTREEIANLIGTATESVIRLLSEFKDDKLIELQGRKIRILDVNGLKKTANLY